ncbi:uncharacterized protein LOC124298221 isoform X1 [Neodiprion virginianus]|uniref:uncharacterized protein LOC124298221 isoform X1 n=2 Tax=Neodiprion virginianus TaxID=2961670 RepID=UPI001EE69872|nr:uncharacterized protein LOC124298221 isoform X1 [Neodiprion virginianus]
MRSFCYYDVPRLRTIKMSWFFGKKKKDSPPDTPEDEDPSAGQGDGFIFVERKEDQQPRPGMIDGFNGPPGPLYPNINTIPQYPPSMPAAAPPNQSIEPIQNILNGLPFKLCKQLEDNLNDDIEIDKNRVNEILSYILRIENGDDIIYDFALEKSVINEIDSAESGI